MSIKDSPNRPVRTLDSTIAFVGHNSSINGDVLIEGIVDQSTNEVQWRSSSKARKNIDYVEADEDLQVLRDFAASHSITEHLEVENQDAPIGEAEMPMWMKLGFKSEEKWVKAGSPTK
jgi:hypothetical protein